MGIYVKRVFPHRKSVGRGCAPSFSAHVRWGEGHPSRTNDCGWEVTAVILAAAASWLLKQSRNARWAREVAIPEIARLADAEKYPEAYSVAVRAEKWAAKDPELVKQWLRISYQMSLETAPPGVNVFRKNYADTAAPWEFVGTTPFRSLRQPRVPVTVVTGAVLSMARLGERAEEAACLRDWPLHPHE
jgi:hypothetical protein